MLPKSLAIAVLVVLAGTVASATADDPAGEPAPAVVHCGQVVTTNTRVANDLAECPADGLVIGTPGITLDLNGHTIDGVGLGAGIRNDGNESATVRNGTVRDFDYGVKLGSRSEGNVVESLILELNQLAGIEVSDADGQGNQIRSNTIRQNGYGIALLGSTGNAVLANTLADNSKEHLIADHSSDNRVERNISNGGSDSAFVFLYSHRNHLGSNSIDGASDGAILFEGSHSNTVVDNRVGLSADSGVLLVGSSANILLANSVQTSGDPPYALIGQSSGNRVQGNFADGGGDAGILVKDSDRNQVIANVAHNSSDDGIGLDTANDNLVRANDVRSNTGGIGLDASSGNRVEFNNVSDEGGTGIELDGEAFGNRIVGNVARRDGSHGIYVAGDTLWQTGAPLEGNVIEANTAVANQSDGINVAKGGHAIGGNVARDNGGWGIYAAYGNFDLGANLAGGNAEAAQCYGLICNPLSLLPEDTTPPQTTIDSGPADPTRSTNALFAFSSSEPHSTFECALDGGDFAPCDPPYGYTGLGTGAHTFRVRAIDEVGNPDPTPATGSWTIDPIAPPTLEPGAYPPDGAVPGAPGIAPAPSGVTSSPVVTYPPVGQGGSSTPRLGRRIARKCGGLRGRRKRICVRRARALARCGRMTGRGRQALRRKAMCRHRARAIGRRR